MRGVWLIVLSILAIVLAFMVWLLPTWAQPWAAIAIILAPGCYIVARGMAKVWARWLTHLERVGRKRVLHNTKRVRRMTTVRKRGDDGPVVM